MNKELLARIEKLETLTAKLEQAIGNIWDSCPCLALPEEDYITVCPEPEDPEWGEEPKEEEVDHD